MNYGQIKKRADIFTSFGSKIQTIFTVMRCKVPVYMPAIDWHVSRYWTMKKPFEIEIFHCAICFLE